MYLVYHPEGSEEPRVFEYKPSKMLSAEREVLEKRTGRTYEQAHQRILEGGSVERRALLWLFLKRDNARLRYEDVEFAWDELTVEFSKQEWAEMREKVEGVLSGDELSQALAAIDDEMETAREEGKALAKSDG
ncbi:hypothetical protein [Streptomyces sp. NBC_00525]|uniref:hypothetical protein n=1 Tax=Streptomyces sp. NBC_00525 TaxID=2903660 RepID=UPI002E805427|nr:hypothetical protein [Streptomyces sp. NBC_00525]WUC97419.1 hypothetical protein OG710_29065 [Streptomyces sp. NBC_00525]